MFQECLRQLYGNAFYRRVSMFQERLRAFYGNDFYRRVSMFQERLRPFYGNAFYRHVSMFQERLRPFYGNAFLLLLDVHVSGACSILRECLLWSCVHVPGASKGNLRV